MRKNLKANGLVALASMVVVNGMLPAIAHDHFLFPHHPHLRRITKAAGIGVLTGGLGGIFLGGGAVHGAMLGAATRGTYRGAKDKWDEKHHHHLR